MFLYETQGWRESNIFFLCRLQPRRHFPQPQDTAVKSENELWCFRERTKEDRTPEREGEREGGGRGNGRGEGEGGWKEKEGN